MFVFSVMWLKLLTMLEINIPLSSVFKYHITSEYYFLCVGDMLMQFVMSVSNVV